MHADSFAEQKVVLGNFPQPLGTPGTGTMTGAGDSLKLKIRIPNHHPMRNVLLRAQTKPGGIRDLINTNVARHTDVRVTAVNSFPSGDFEVYFQDIHDLRQFSDYAGWL